MFRPFMLKCCSEAAGFTHKIYGHQIKNANCLAKKGCTQQQENVATIS